MASVSWLRLAVAEGSWLKESGEMIVRIHMEDQYRLSDAAAAEVDKLDDALLAALDANDTAAFSAALDQLLAYVRAQGEKVPTDEIVPSDAILPSADMTLEDARAILEQPAAQPATPPAAPPAQE